MHRAIAARFAKDDVHQDFAPTAFEADRQDADTDGRPSAGRLHAFLRRVGIGHSGLRDRQTGLLNRRGLLERGDRLLAARRTAKAALLLFDFSDLLELRGLYGSQAVTRAGASLVERLVRLAGRRGLAARTGPAQFGVLLPQMGRQQAIDAAHRVFGSPCRLEFDLGREEVVLVPNTIVDVCDAERGALEALYTQLSVSLARRRDLEERRKRKLRHGRRHAAALGPDFSANDSLAGAGSAVRHG